ncbi:hypothetical protein FA13DRAFT_722632 [Coprinellus micaceus]|uniref:BTB domain-containing protein n=1 Tax=Coprinellus micaceus TaxID=71717 RepID=A0A4Y7TW23_COPMI|nr:hypothetical protein FA13DRAFT_722632 [Coprinellus micaceus]
MSTFEEDKISTGEMTAITEPVGRKHETYYWSDSVEFLVEDVLFRIPQYPFRVGSQYFIEKFGLSLRDGTNAARGVVTLPGVTAAQFQVFLKLLFPMHLTSTTTVFTKAEWLTILTLSTLWHFHEARKLAIQHLDGHNLTEMELIEVGRATSISRWVLAGFKSIAGRPQGCVISNEEANAIGHQAAHKVWTIRYQLAVAGDELDLSEDFIERELRSKFSEELAALKATELEHRTKADIERAEREEEERRKQEEEAKAVAEREQLAEEKRQREKEERLRRRQEIRERERRERKRGTRAPGKAEP